MVRGVCESQRYFHGIDDAGSLEKFQYRYPFERLLTREAAHLENGMIRTFGDGQEADQNKRIFVSSPGMIPHISDREIDRMIFVLASCDRNSRFVTSKND